MKKLKLSNSNFLKWYIKEEKYLQNPPLETKIFIRFCKKRGIITNEEELEFFEKEKLLYPIIRIERPIEKEERIIFKKDEREFWRPAKFGLQEGEKEIDRKEVTFYSLYRFDENSKDLLSNWIEKGNLFDPSTKSFQEWKTFKGKELQYNRHKIVSLYSSFQIYWLNILKKAYSFNINFGGKNIKISSSLSFVNNINYTLSFSVTKYKDFISKLEEILKKKFPQTFFDFNQKKKELKREYVKFNKFLKFMLSIQNVYYPYARSSSRTIQIRGDLKKWQKIKRALDLKNVLDLLDLKIGYIVEWYKILSDKSRRLLGIVRDDWVQLWKNISFVRKNNLEGSVRLGVEYLQWAIILKKVIESYQEKEILDIDEIKNVDAKDILKYNPSQMDQYGILLRATRNIRYTDPKEKKNYYYDKFKRLFYIANDFKLDYQPRVIVFVEGRTEETLLPKVFEWFYDKPENLGIEFVNFRGVDQLMSTSKNAEKLRQLIIKLQREERKQILSKNKNKELSRLIRDLNNVNIVISNWTSFLSYNLEKWQIIPFFIADDEGNIKHFLEAEKPIWFDAKDYNVPQNWRHLWGVDNKNKPFVGKDFEMANFSNQEIATVLTELLGKNITENQIQTLRDNGEGIKKIDNNIERMKTKIAEKLFNNLFNEYAENIGDSVLKRPVFKVIEKIVKLAVLNHPPTCRKIELKNKEIIKENLLRGSIK